MVVFSGAAIKYGYHPQERKMLVIDGYIPLAMRFYVLFNVDNTYAIETDSLYMVFDTLTEALEIFDDRTILKPIEN